jgi:hypothetical protein
MLLAFNHFNPGVLPKKGATMRNPDWPKVEPGIWLICKAPRTYWVEVGRENGNRKARKKVLGDIHFARRIKSELWNKLESRSLKSSGQYTNISSALAYYIRSHYRRTAQWKTGSGRAIMRFWMIRIGRMISAHLRNTDINRIVQGMQADGFKTSGIIPYVSRLKTALIFARMGGKISLRDDVFSDLVKLKTAPVPKLSIPDEDIDRIFSGIPEWGRPVIIYKRLVPCRLLELYEAKTEHVDLDKKCFTLFENKNNVPRTMPIPEPMEEYFRYAKRCGSEWVFFREEKDEGKNSTFCKLSRNHLTKLFSGARDALGIDRRVVLRLLRHTTVRKWLRVVDGNVVGAVAGASEQTLKTFYDMVEIDTITEATRKIVEIHGHLADTCSKLKVFGLKKEAASA